MFSRRFALRGYLLRGTIAAFGVLSAAAQLSGQFPTRQQVITVQTRVNDRWIADHPLAGGNTNNWNGAVYMIGNVAAYDSTGNSAYLNYALSWANTYNYGLFGGDASRHADHQAAGQVYLRLYQLMGDPARLAHIRASVQGMVISTAFNDWTWCDALHMAMPTFAGLGQVYQDPAYAAKMYSLYNYCARQINSVGLYNTADVLWARDTTYLSPPAASRVYWSRGNAWVFVALAKTLDVLPISDPHYTEYLATFRAMAAKLLTLQQADGFWRADLTNPLRYPTPETSGTAGFAFGLAWGINAGALDAATYQPALLKAWTGLTTVAVQPNGFLGYVQGVGKDPSDNQPVTASNTTDFGVGLFLMAAAEITQLTRDQTAPPVFNFPEGSYTAGQTIAMSTETAGAVIRFTTDGRTPSATVGTTYTSPLIVSQTQTLQAIALKSGLTDSTVTAATYTFVASSPPPGGVTVTVAGGNYSASGASGGWLAGAIGVLSLGRLAARGRRI